MKLVALALAAAALALSAPPDPPRSKIAGSPTAQLRLELYGDFTCPHCRTVHETVLPRLIKDFVDPGKAYIVFRDFVLTGPGHEYSRSAATYAAAAARLSKYQAASDALFRTQALWVRSGLIWPNISNVFTPDEQKKMQAMINDRMIATDVQNDIDAGNMIPLTQTPTLVVRHGGKATPWGVWNEYGLLKSYLDSLLK